ncbi:MAG: hypothetical protein ACOZBH_01240 [Patescibacteria group bacterium]
MNCRRRENKMTASEMLGLVSSLLIIPVYFIYLKQISKGESIPNPATWIILLVVMSMNAVTFAIMVISWEKCLLAIFCAAMTIIVFVYSYIKRKFVEFSKLDYFCLALAAAVGILWLTTGNARLANLMLQIILFVSFVPIWVGLKSGRLKEKSPPWILGVISYCLTLAVIISNWSGDIAQLLYPLVNGILGNGSVAVMAIHYNRKRIIA